MGDCSGAESEVLSGELPLMHILDAPNCLLSEHWVVLDGAAHSRVKLTLGLVRDSTVSSEHLQVRPLLKAWLPTQPYFSSDVLPLAWVSCMQTVHQAVVENAVELGEDCT